MLRRVIDSFGNRVPRAVNTLEEGFDDAVVILHNGSRRLVLSNHEDMAIEMRWGKPISIGGEWELQIVGAIAVLVPAVALSAAAFWALIKPPIARPGYLLSEGVLTFGLSVLLNLAYPWFTLGYFARLTTLVLMVFSGLARVVTAWRASDGIKPLLSFSISDLVKIIVGALSMVVIPFMAINMPVKEAMDMESPFSEGVWYVAQGGGLSLVNHHYRDTKQRYSLDLVRLNSIGARRSGPSSSVESYLAWESKVVAPVYGIVIEAVDGLPDMEIGQRDKENPAGNHVIVETIGYVRLYLCHLKRGSIKVREGDWVNAGQVLAEVGNSGNTSEPHLHVQATAFNGDVWVGIPLRIQGAVLHKGQMIRSK